MVEGIGGLGHIPPPSHNDNSLTEAKKMASEIGTDLSVVLSDPGPQFLTKAGNEIWAHNLSGNIDNFAAIYETLNKGDQKQLKPFVSTLIQHGLLTGPDNPQLPWRNDMSKENCLKEVYNIMGPGGTASVCDQDQYGHLTLNGNGQDFINQLSEEGYYPLSPSK